MKRLFTTATTLLSALGLLRVLPLAAGPADPPEVGQPASRQTGVIEGTVTFRGVIPRSATPDDAGVHRELLRVDRPTGGVQDVVVWLVPGPGGAGGSSSPKPPEGSEPSAALMDQRDHEFVPRVLAVRARQPVRFTNSDPANHNVRTSASRRTNEFNVFTGMEGSYMHRFDPEPEPIRVGCDIHPWMRGWIYVFDHPHFAVTDAQGHFRLADVSPGRYRVAVRQPDLRHADEREVIVAAGQTVRFQVEVRAPVKSGPAGGD